MGGRAPPQRAPRRQGFVAAIAISPGLQGAALLANTLNDPGILRAEVRRIERWLGDLTEA